METGRHHADDDEPDKSGSSNSTERRSSVPPLVIPRESLFAGQEKPATPPREFLAFLQQSEQHARQNHEHNDEDDDEDSSESSATMRPENAKENTPEVPRHESSNQPPTELPEVTGEAIEIDLTADAATAPQAEELHEPVPEYAEELSPASNWFSDEQAPVGSPDNTQSTRPVSSPAFQPMHTVQQEQASETTAPPPPPNQYYAPPPVHPQSAGNRPPVPPIPPRPRSDFAESTPPPQNEGFDQAFRARPNVLPTAQSDSVELEYARQSGERTGLARGLMAGFIVGLVVRGHFAKKAAHNERAVFNKQFAGQQAEISSLQTTQKTLEQNAVRDRYAFDQQRAAWRANAAPQALPVPGETIFAETPSAATPEQPATPDLTETLAEQADRRAHVKHSAWHDIVVDERGRPIEGAVVYGQAFQEELVHERIPTPFGTDDMRFKVGAFSTPQGSSAGQQVTDVGDDTNISMSTVPQPARDESTPYWQPPRTKRQKPKDPIVAAVTSPWLWLGVGIVLIVFFAASAI